MGREVGILSRDRAQSLCAEFQGRCWMWQVSPGREAGCVLRRRHCSEGPTLQGLLSVWQALKLDPICSLGLNRLTYIDQIHRD